MQRAVIHYAGLVIAVRQDQVADFASIVEQSVRQTEERHREPTKTGRVFEKLIPYFFSALDYRLSCEQPAPPPLQPAPSPEPIHRTYQPGHAPHHRAAQPAKPAQTTDILAQRATARRAAEAAGRTKVRAPETLALHIKAAALTFNDDQEKSSVQRAANLMADAGLDEQTMLDLVAQARAAASQSHKITKKNRHGKINRMPYFFTILRAKILEELDHQ